MAEVNERVAAVIAELALDRPRILPLPGGMLNRSWRLRDVRQDLVLRLAHDASASLGADPESEFRMQNLAAAAGLAPEIILARPAEGLFVTRHVAGRPLVRNDLRNAAMLERIGAWMARLHALPLPPGLPPVDIGARATGYLEALQAREPDARHAALMDRLAVRRSSLEPPAQWSACHHDLHHGNIVDTGGALVALDWEYAGPGDPVADLAACVGYHTFDTPPVDALLAGYGTDSPALRARLEIMGWIFDCLWYGWIGVAAATGERSDEETRARLAARLGA